MIREIANVETPFVRVCKRLKWLAVKFTIPQRRGAPDRQVFKGLGEAVKMWTHFTGETGPEAEAHVRLLIFLVLEFVELKKPDKEPEPHQLRRHAELYALGFKTTVLDSPEAVKRWASAR